MTDRSGVRTDALRGLLLMAVSVSLLVGEDHFHSIVPVTFWNMALSFLCYLSGMLTGFSGMDMLGKALCRYLGVPKSWGFWSFLIFWFLLLSDGIFGYKASQTGRWTPFVIWFPISLLLSVVLVAWMILRAKKMGQNSQPPLFDVLERVSAPRT